MELQQGNRIAVRGRMSIKIVTVDRVTAKQAFAENYKFKREYNNTGRIIQIGGDNSPWNSTYFYISNDKYEKDYKRQNLIYAIKAVSWEDVDDDTLERVFNCIQWHK